MQERLVKSITIDEAGQPIACQSHAVDVTAVELGNGTTIDLALIPAGSFLMGSPRGEGYDDERPRHEVTLPSFMMAVHEVTQAQWHAVTGTRPRCRFAGPDRPVDNVSWDAAADFCDRLSQANERCYALPSEAQWEYACRAGTTTPFHFGPTLTPDLANYNGAFTFRGELPGVYRHVTLDVGSFPPNPFGLFDMHGNLWEWCADAWHPDYVGAPADGSAWDCDCLLRERVARGGSWHEPPEVCRSALRIKFPQAEGDDFIGFRVVSPLN